MKHLSISSICIFATFCVHLSLTQESQATGIVPGAPQERPIAIVGGTIHAVSSAPIENGTLVFDGGRITAVGTDIEVPENSERIDAAGKRVYPALFDAHTQLGLVEIDSVRPTLDMEETGQINPNVMACERGASFGYNTLVADMRALPIMAETACPVIFDATHSVQQPGGQGTSSGGDRRYVPVLARAAVAVGVAGLFIETHQDPDNAPSDGPNMVPLAEFEGLMRSLMEIDAVVKQPRAR